jgi:hypothetical protein
VRSKIEDIHKTLKLRAKNSLLAPQKLGFFPSLLVSKYLSGNLGSFHRLI